MSPARSRAEDGVGHGVADDVGIGMPLQAGLERDRDAAKDERPTRDEAVQIVSGADAQARWRGRAGAESLARPCEVLCRR